MDVPKARARVAAAQQQQNIAMHNYSDAKTWPEINARKIELDAATKELMAAQDDLFAAQKAADVSNPVIAQGFVDAASALIGSRFSPFLDYSGALADAQKAERAAYSGAFGLSAINNLNANMNAFSNNPPAYSPNINTGFVPPSSSSGNSSNPIAYDPYSDSSTNNRGDSSNNNSSTQAYDPYGDNTTGQGRASNSNNSRGQSRSSGVAYSPYGDDTPSGLNIYDGTPYGLDVNYAAGSQSIASRLQRDMDAEKQQQAEQQRQQQIQQQQQQQQQRQQQIQSQPVPQAPQATQPLQNQLTTKAASKGVGISIHNTSVGDRVRWTSDNGSKTWCGTVTWIAPKPNINLAQNKVWPVKIKSDGGELINELLYESSSLNPKFCKA